MIKRIVKSSVIVLSLLMLFGCGKSNEVSYQVGFPKKDSPALMEFMYYSINRNFTSLIMEKKDVYYYSNNLYHNDWLFAKYSKKSIEELYQPMFTSSEYAKEFNQISLGKDFGELGEKIETPLEEGLPEIIFEKGNVLNVTTKYGHLDFDVPKELNNQAYKNSEDFSVAVKVVKDDGLIIKIFYTGETHYLLTNQQLTESLFVQKKDLESTIESGGLTKYYSLMSQLDSQGEYLLLEGLLIESKTNKVIHLHDNDYLSEDGMYVYINGKQRDIKNGKQYIQTIENYIIGNKIYEKEFSIDFMKIAKKLEYKSGSVGFAKVYYFNKDFVVLSVNYHQIIAGDAGFANIIIDLQGSKNYTAYLVDLGLQ